MGRSKCIQRICRTKTLCGATKFEVWLAGGGFGDSFPQLWVSNFQDFVNFRNNNNCAVLFDRYWPQREILPGEGGKDYGPPPSLIGMENDIADENGGTTEIYGGNRYSE
jgi:hypothetical protein